MIDWEMKARHLADLVQTLAFVIGSIGVTMMVVLDGWGAGGGFVLLMLAVSAFDDGKIATWKDK